MIVFMSDNIANMEEHSSDNITSHSSARAAISEEATFAPGLTSLRERCFREIGEAGGHFAARNELAYLSPWLIVTRVGTAGCLTGPIAPA